MKAKTIATVLLIAAALAVPAIPSPVGFPVLVDLSHKQPLLGLDVIIRTVPEAQWYVLVKTPEDAQALPSSIASNALVLVGDLSKVDLEKLGIVMVIFGQPQAPPSPEEIAALAKWLRAAPGRALWVAADSDYPAQGGPQSQEWANMIMEAVGAHLRIDYASAEDRVSNASAGYRVLAFANVSEIPVLRYGVDRVLFHGPGPVAWVDDTGKWHKLTPAEKPANVYIIATTSPRGEIVKNSQVKLPNAYQPGDRGAIALMAAELIPVKGGYATVLLSGESPYGAYQPIATWMYYGNILSGPRFIRNVILWATGYMGELKEYAKLATLPDQIRSEVNALASQLRSDVDARLSKVESAIAGVSSTLNMALGLAALALILAIVALALSLRKPKAAQETVVKKE